MEKERSKMMAREENTPQPGDERDLEKRLLRYSTVASLALAAGLALPAQPAHADRVWIDVNPDQTIGPGGTFDLSFDQDTDPEFSLRVNNWSTWVYVVRQSGGGDQGLSVSATTSGAFVYAFTNVSSNIIGPIGSWENAGLVTVGYNSSGFWPGRGNRFLGLRFNLDGAGPYYGWAYLEVAPGSTSFTIREYGYEDIQGLGFHCQAGGPTAVTLAAMDASAAPLRLSLLGGALGASVLGLSAWVRRRLSRRDV